MFKIAYCLCWSICTVLLCMQGAHLNKWSLHHLWYPLVGVPVSMSSKGWRCILCSLLSGWELSLCVTTTSHLVIQRRAQQRQQHNRTENYSYMVSGAILCYVTEAAITSGNRPNQALLFQKATRHAERNWDTWFYIHDKLDNTFIKVKSWFLM